MDCPLTPFSRLLKTCRTWTLLAILPASVSMASVASASEISITSADGNMIQGEIVQLDAEGLQVKDGSETLTLPLDELSQLNFDHDPQPPLPMRAQLAGGSQLGITGLTWTDNTVNIAVARQSSLTIPAQQLRWVRFQKGNSATDPTWLGWLEETRRGDRLVVRRNEKALDSIDGTVKGITRDTVSFEMRGNPIEAPLPKLEGILFSNTTQDDATGDIRVVDTSGSEWMAESISMPVGSSHIQLRLAGGIEHAVPLDQVRRIGFAGGILSLSDVEVAAANFDSDRQDSGKSVNTSDLDNWFAPQSDNGVIRIQAPGKITLRIPDGYQKLIVAARRSQDVSEFTALRLDVLVDGAVQWTATLQDRESLGLELPISGARQLTLRASRMSQSNDTTSPVGAALGGSVEWFSGRLLK